LLNHDCFNRLSRNPNLRRSVLARTLETRLEALSSPREKHNYQCSPRLRHTAYRIPDRMEQAAHSGLLITEV
jgi:hypothetical protein